MSSLALALISLACIFSGALAGCWLKNLLPEHHLLDDSRETVKVGAGMLATLSALVLGLLIGSAKTSFDAVNNGFMVVGSKAIHMGRILDQYGPEAGEARKQVGMAVADMLDTVWPEEKSLGNGGKASSAFETAGGMEKVQAAIRAIKPHDETQRSQLAEALQLNSDLLQTRWVLVEQAKVELPTPLLAVLISWLTILFISFGLFAPRNVTAMTVLFISAVALSAAIFLILEMNGPLDGMIKVSSAPLHTALEVLSTTPR